MRMDFQYDLEQQYMQSISLDDVGNTCLCCRTETGDEYYLLVKTVMGKTSMLKLGPVCSDVPELTNNYCCFYKKFDYNEHGIFKEINTFINDVKKKIVMIEEIERDVAVQVIPNVIDLFMME